MARAWKLALACALLALGAPARAEEPDFHGFYQLSFDRYGRLTNPYELDIAIAGARPTTTTSRRTTAPTSATSSTSCCRVLCAGG